MNYRNKKVAVTGWSGFIGQHLVKALKDQGATVILITGDVRHRGSFHKIDHTFDYLFHFAAPSSQVLFNRKPYHCLQVTLLGMMNALEVCNNYGVKLVYPSTGLLSSDRFNEYALAKKTCENLAQGADALGIRLFAAYGPGEGHKRDYASVPYLFARDFADERQPVVFGDGSQKRDFIYIEDAVTGIIRLAEMCNDPVIDLGSGESSTFNEILDACAAATQVMIKPVYVDRPSGYVDETHAEVEKLHQYYTPSIGLKEGIRKTVESLKPSEEEAE